MFGEDGTDELEFGDGDTLSDTTGNGEFGVDSKGLDFDK